jgi:NitT/TauT family transport system permease protein
MMLRKFSFVLWPALFGLVFLALWYAVIRLFGLPRYQLPSPGEVLAAMRSEAPVLLVGAGRTLAACFCGFTTSVAGGFLLSLALTASPRFYQGLYPWIVAFKMMPVIVIAPIVIIWCGQGLLSVTVITFLICFFPVVANTTMGLISTDRGLQNVFAVFGQTRWQEMRHLRIPHALPYFLTGLRIAAALTPIGALYGDTLAGSGSTAGGGLGFLVLVYNSQLKVPELFATAIVACLLGFIFVGLVNLLSWSLLRRWHESYVGQRN